MQTVTEVSRKVVDSLLAVFQDIHPFWALLAVSVPLGIFMLLVFRHTSNQEEIRKAKNRIKAHILEIRLFKDDLRILLSAQKNILLHNLRYMRHALRPVLFMIIPIAYILLLLEGWFGYQPLKPGETTVASVVVANGGADVLSQVSLQGDEGLIVETPPLRIAEDHAVNWRVRAAAPGDHMLTFTVAGETVRKKVSVMDGRLTRVTPRLVAAPTFWDTLLHPGEASITNQNRVRYLEIEYPSRTIDILGWELHWLLVFFVLSTVAGFALKNFFRVEI